jgi:hypothetical protein
MNRTDKELTLLRSGCAKILRIRIGMSRLSIGDSDGSVEIRRWRSPRFRSGLLEIALLLMLKRVRRSRRGLMLIRVYVNGRKELNDETSTNDMKVILPVIVRLRGYDMWGLQWKLGCTRNVRITGRSCLQTSWMRLDNYQISMLPDMLKCNQWRWERTKSMNILNCNQWCKLHGVRNIPVIVRLRGYDMWGL